MKIAINTRFLLPNKLEGMGWFTHEVLKRWVEWYPQHEFIFIFDRPFDKQFIFGENVKGVSTFPPARHPFLFYWWYEWSLPPLLKRLKADVFVSPDGFASLRSEVPTLMVLHDIAWKHFPDHVPFLVRKFYAHYVPKYCHHVKQIATVSEYSKQDIVNSFGLAEDKVDVVYNGSLSPYHPISDKEKQAIQQKYAAGEPYFLYVGSIHPRKNVPNLLKAFDRFKKATNAPVKLLLAGRMAWQTGEVGELLPTLTHRKDIVFLGYVANEALPKIMAGAYAMTYVSLFEGFGIPLLEAMYCEVPSITSSVSSMPEVVGEAGLLADPKSVEAIANQMQAIWTKPDLRAALVAKGRTQRQKFSWDLTAKKLWKSLEKIV